MLAVFDSAMIAKYHRLLTVAIATWMVIVLGGCDRASQAPPTELPSVPNTSMSFGDFQFETPIGWSRAQPDRDKTMAMVLLNGTTWSRADGMIKVDVGKPTLPNAEAMARALAGSDGQVLVDPVFVDGESGVRVKTTSTDMSKPSHAVVVFRNGKVYLIMAAGGNGVDVTDAFDHALQTWRWTKKP